MREKALIGVVVCSFAVTATATGAFASEKGQFEQGNGRSICMFSGLNDDPDEPGEEGRVQSFGQIVKQVGPIGGVPGVACNPNTGPDLKPRP